MVSGAGPAETQDRRRAPRVRKIVLSNPCLRTDFKRRLLWREYCDNEGLCVAEIELEHEDEMFDLPAWAGAEVTDDPRYANASLVREPYRNWRERD